MIRVDGQGHKTLDCNSTASIFENKWVSSILSAEQGMLPSDAVSRQLLSVVQGLGPESDTYLSGSDLDRGINRFTGGCKVFDV